jgi:hypothetical protein
VPQRPPRIPRRRAADDRELAVHVIPVPTNQALMAIGLEDAGAHSRSQIIRWNKLHSVRTVFGSLAIRAFLIDLS